MSVPRTPAALTDSQARELENSMPAIQNALLGSRLQELQDSSPYVQKVVIDAAANATAKAFTADVSGEIIDMWAVATAASGSGTATVRRSTTAISSAIVMAVDTVSARSLNRVTAQAVVTQGEALNIITAGANDRGQVFIAIKRS